MLRPPSLPRPPPPLRVRDRLEHEYNIDIITTAPSVVYRIHRRDRSVQELNNSADMPDLSHVDRVEETRIKTTILFHGQELSRTCRTPRGCAPTKGPRGQISTVPGAVLDWPWPRRLTGAGREKEKPDAHRLILAAAFVVLATPAFAFQSRA